MEKKSFPKEIIERFTKPWNWAFSGYLIIAIIFGGAGVFFTISEVYRNEWIDIHKIAESIAIIFVAVIATAFIDLNVSTQLKNRLSFLIYSFIFYGIAVVLLWLTFDLKSIHSFIPSSIGLVLAVFIWILANADKQFSEENFISEMRGDKVEHGKGW